MDLQSVSDYLDNPIWLLEYDEGVRLVDIRIKVAPRNCLAVLKGISPEGPKVAFVGASSLEALCRKLCNRGDLCHVRWRIDRYALDGFSEKE